MNKSDSILLTFVFTLFFSICSFAQNSTETITHVVDRGETLSSISRSYNVSVKEIMELNNRSDEKLFAGETLRIPNKKGKFHKIEYGETLYALSNKYGVTVDAICQANPGLTIETFKAGQVIVIPLPGTSDVKKDETVEHVETVVSSNDKSDDVCDISLVLPFNASSKEKSRLVEFYEGLLIGALDLKSKGLSMNINVFDNHTQKMEQILQDYNFKKSDIIIGPLVSEDIKPLADFAEENHKHLVVPFTTKVNDVFSNPYVFQVNTPQSYVYSEVSAKFIDKFGKCNLVFIEDRKYTDKKNFMEVLKHDLKTNNISYKVLSTENLATNLVDMASVDKTTVFIPNSGKSTLLALVLPYLKNVKNQKPEAEISLFGYPEWQTYTHDFISDFYELDTYFYSSFYANNLSEVSYDFYNKYKKWYHKEMANTYPKYGMLGYDIITYFGTYWLKYGSDYYKNLNSLEITPVQTGFRFERVNNWGGFMNKKIFFIHFSRDLGLKTVDFD